MPRRGRCFRMIPTAFRRLIKGGDIRREQKVNYWRECVPDAGVQERNRRLQENARHSWPLWLYVAEVKDHCHNATIGSYEGKLAEAIRYAKQRGKDHKVRRGWYVPVMPLYIKGTPWYTVCRWNSRRTCEGDLHTKWIAA